MAEKAGMLRHSLSNSHTGTVVGKAESFKKPFKEKFVSLYEDIFAGRSPIHTAKDQGVQGRAALARFWDELLLLKVNDAHLAQFIARASEEQLRGELRPTINELFATCVRYLRDENSIRIVHALETLTILLREIFKKRFTEQGFTIITLVSGSIQNSDSFFRLLLTDVAGLLTRHDMPVPVKGLRLYLTILTATDNVNTNSLASYLFSNNIFDGLVAVLTGPVRRDLELDAALSLILVLLWRESPNPYSERLSSAAAPIMPLLGTVIRFLNSPTQAVLTASGTANTLTSPRWSSVDGVFGYIGSLLGFPQLRDGNEHVGGTGNLKGATGISPPALENPDVMWCNTTAALFLIYFICYLNPVYKSTKVWSSDFSLSQGGLPPEPALWLEVCKSFLDVCKEVLQQLPTSGAEGVLRAKLCLTVLRCMVEDHVLADLLARCDANNLSLHQVPSNGLAGIPFSLQFKNLSCVIIDLAIGVLGLKPDLAHLDPDIFYRAALLIPIILSYFKTRALQLLPTSINWFGLWQVLVETCKWCGTEVMFEKPGVPEVGELTLAVLESCLGSSQELCGAPEETDRLHAMVMSHTNCLEQLVRTASGTPFGDARRSSLRGGIKIVNVAAVKFHYEVQIAALGVRGEPTFEQALLGVKKKGLANLKLKSRHAGPTHSYTEGIVELRLLTSLARLLVAEHGKYAGVAKSELDAM